MALSRGSWFARWQTETTKSRKEDLSGDPLSCSGFHFWRTHDQDGVGCLIQNGLRGTPYQAAQHPLTSVRRYGNQSSVTVCVNPTGFRLMENRSGHIRTRLDR